MTLMSSAIITYDVPCERGTQIFSMKCEIRFCISCHIRREYAHNYQRLI